MPERKHPPSIRDDAITKTQQDTPECTLPPSTQPATVNPQPSYNAQTTPAAKPEKETGAHQGRQVEATEPQAGASLACALPVVTESELPWFDQVMSRPPRDIASRLLPDTCISSTLQDPDISLDCYKQEVAHRQQTEAAQREYTFKPFLVTLHNMKLLTQNILDGQQFAQPLNQEDREAFLILGERIEQLIAAKAPYRRTIELALLMTCMQDVVTARYLLPDLRKAAPELFSEHRLRGGYPFIAAPDPDSDNRHWKARKAEDIPLQQLLSCAFGTLNPGGQSERQLFFYDKPNIHSRLPEWLANPQLILYPTFGLSPQDRCRLSHLPVYPLEMITAHALNLGSDMMTPRSLFMHGIDGAETSRLWEQQEGEHPLEKPAMRLQLRHWALDRLPAALQEHQLEQAVTLALSHILCSFRIADVAKQLASDSFLRLFYYVERARRHHFFPYCPAVQNISQWQSMLACLWVHRLCKYQEDCPESSPANMSARFGRRFVQTDMAALVAHWRFLQDNFHVLHEDFLARAEKHYDPYYGSHAECRRRSIHLGFRLNLSIKPREGDEIDQTTLVYMDGLHDPDERAQMAKVTGSDIPDGAL